ncbi:MAG: PAS domain S-box protein [bacterium]|nr:PAS domain S-box protein [bacterium]
MIYFLILPMRLDGETKNIKFEAIYAENHLSQSAVCDIIRDSRGFFWLGTQDGVNRYDGCRFKVYKNNPTDPETISGNYIEAIREDREGYLWMSIRSAGLNRYDWRTETFKRFNTSMPNSISNDAVTTILVDTNDKIWIGTDGDGINVLNKKTGSFTYYRHSPSDKRSLGNNSVNYLYQDKKERIWVGTKNGLYCLLHGAPGFISYKNDPADSSSLSDNDVLSIYEDHAGIIWVGTVKGLNRFDGKSAGFDCFFKDPANPASLSCNTIKSITGDKSGRLWFGTGTTNITGSGITILDTAEMVFYRYIHKGPGSHILNNLSVLSVYKDPEGTIWIGTYGSGAYKCNPHKYRFAYCSSEPGNKNSLNRNYIWAIYEDRDKNLWVGTLGGGLNRIDYKTGDYTHFMNQPDNPASLTNNSVKTILEDSRGYIWVGTQEGLDRLDTKTGIFKHFRLKEDALRDTAGILQAEHLHEDSNGLLWIGTWGDGIFRYDKKTGVFKQFLKTADPKSVGGNKISFIYEEPNGNIWICTDTGGISKFNHTSGDFTRFQNEPGNLNSLSSNCVMALLADREGVLWVGTWGGGLNKFDRQNNRVSHYVEEDGLGNNSIYAVMEDAQGNLWMGTNSGISKFNPKNEIFTNYVVSDGLQAAEFNQGASHKSRSGILYFGGINGFNFFDPAKLSGNSRIPPVVITDFKIFGKSVKPKPNGAYKFKRHDVAELVLSYRENNFSFDYAALDYTSSQNNRYAVKLEGFEDRWFYSGRRSVTYTNLDGGNYVLRIKGSNNDGIWNTKGMTVNITIIPPIWKTWWFKTAMAFLLFAGVMLVFYVRTKKLRVRLHQEQKIQAKLKESKIQLQNAKDVIECSHAEKLMLIASISSILIAVDEEGRITLWNVPAEEFFEKTAAECIGKKFTGVLASFIECGVLQGLIDTGFAPGSGVEEREVKVDFDGHRYMLQVIIDPIKNKSGNKHGILLLCENISARKAEEAQQHLLLKLKAVGEMYAGILHEINTPIQYVYINNKIITDSSSKIGENYKALCGHIATMLEGALSGDGCVQATELQYLHRLVEESSLPALVDRVSRSAELINDGVDRVKTIAKTMREFFHEGNKIMEMCDINKLIKSNLLVCQYNLKDTAEIKTRLAKGQLITYCYPAELNLVFFNLIFNAADAIAETNKRGEIVVSTTKVKTGDTGSKDEILIEISDTGSGIPEEIERKVFNAFFTTKGVGKGTGQGLSLALRIMEKHKGKLYFKSMPGKGTTFFVHLPVSPGSMVGFG